MDDQKKEQNQPKVFGKPEQAMDSVHPYQAGQGQSRAGAKMATAVLKLCAGLIMGIVGLIVTLLSSGIATGIMAGLLYVGMILLFISGGKTFTLGKLLKKYQPVLKNRKTYDLAELANVMQKPVNEVYRDLKKLADKGYLESVYFAPDRSCVMFDLKVYEEYMKHVQAVPQKQGEDAFAGENSGYIAKMADIRSRVENPAMAEKIKKLEITTGKILDYGKEHPQRKQEISKFMRYYLPTTVKLLQTYDEMNAQNIDGKTISGSMGHIETSMDSINASFERLLDGLFQSSAMDVNAEINVLQSMLQQEGLSGEDGTLIMNIPAADGSSEDEIPELHL